MLPVPDFCPPLVFPDWPAPTCVCAFQSTRLGGVSSAPFDSLNLGDHVGDAPEKVRMNREKLFPADWPIKPVWLQQIHGTDVLEIDPWLDAVASSLMCPPKADAAVSRTPGNACLIMTADCLPVVFCNRRGTVVAAAHAGWRGLCDGVLEKTVLAMDCPPADILVWLGPAIGSSVFEVGGEVREAFMARNPDAQAAFWPSQIAGKWLGNLPLLARQRLATLGIRAVYGGEECTFSQPDRYFSYRRDGQTGRMVTAVWLAV